MKTQIDIIPFQEDDNSINKKRKRESDDDEESSEGIQSDNDGSSTLSFVPSITSVVDFSKSIFQDHIPSQKDMLRNCAWCMGLLVFAGFRGFIKNYSELSRDPQIFQKQFDTSNVNKPNTTYHTPRATPFVSEYSFEQ